VIQEARPIAHQEVKDSDLLNDHRAVRVQRHQDHIKNSISQTEEETAVHQLVQIARMERKPTDLPRTDLKVRGQVKDLTSLLRNATVIHPRVIVHPGRKAMDLVPKDRLVDPKVLEGQVRDLISVLRNVTVIPRPVIVRPERKATTLPQKNLTSLT
jgi:hypothetical protein